VTAKSAVAIETDVLKSWRSTLGLRSYLTRSQMPQGRWTETVAAGRVDLPATVARICKLALRPEARACVLASGQSPLPPLPARFARTRRKLGIAAGTPSRGWRSGFCYLLEGAHSGRPGAV
jgi:hypothetical protein